MIISFPRDSNRIAVLGGTSSTDGVTPVLPWVDPSTHRLLVDVSGAGVGLTVGTTTITSGTTTRILYDNAGVLGEYTISGSGTIVAMATAPTFGTSITGSYLTASTILIADGSKNIISADTVTYPSLTELSYVKGVTSAIQTQINAKGSGTVTAVSIATANGFSGSSSGGATPALTIVAGAITPTSVNGLTITTTTGTFTLTNAKTLSVTNTLTLSGTDSTTMTFPTTSATIARTDAGQTFTGTNAFGVITATTLNGNTFTTGTYTLTGVAGKTLTFNKSITLEGTDSTTMTFPSTSATIARTDAAQTFTGTQTFSQVIQTANAITASGNAATIPVTSGHNIVTNNSAATLTITLTTTSAVNMQMVVVQILDFSAAAQTITWVNTEDSTVSAPTTSNGSTTLPLTAGFIYNSATSKWRCIASA